jgi:hypothetical protein
MRCLFCLGTGREQPNRFLENAALIGTAVPEDNRLAVLGCNLVEYLDADV